MVDLRWYKGKFLVMVVLKSKGNYLVEAIEKCLVGNKQLGYRWIPSGEQFTTVPRLLYLPKNDSAKMAPCGCIMWKKGEKFFIKPCGREGCQTYTYVLEKSKERGNVIEFKVS